LGADELKELLMFKLVLIRHGQSVWNLENRFTGWTDVDLSDQGRAEACAAGKLLCELGYEFDLAFTSVLKRAIRTLNRIQEEMDLDWIPVIRAWQLNERHYGTLQGLNKAEMAEKFGEAQIKIWRRSDDVLPPSVGLTDERHPKFDRRYVDLTPEQLPVAESLKITQERVLPYWHTVMEPNIKSGKRVLISAHGNSIRALIKYLDHISDAEVTQLNIPTGMPLVYELDNKFRVIQHYYLGGSEDIAKAAVAHQGIAKIC
jgi:2,3-bisphosphoglycerate-dependent phosphoglycerate mutase